MSPAAFVPSNTRAAKKTSLDVPDSNKTAPARAALLSSAPPSKVLSKIMLVASSSPNTLVLVAGSSVSEGLRPPDLPSTTTNRSDTSPAS